MTRNSIRKEIGREAAAAGRRKTINIQTVEALVDAAVSTCEPENADEKATEYTRKVLRRKFHEILAPQR
jgi:hypothetical protein